jgi:hypothetical protein
MLARNGKGHNAGIMKSCMHYQGTGGAWRQYGVVKQGQVPEAQVWWRASQGRHGGNGNKWELIVSLTTLLTSVPKDNPLVHTLKGSLGTEEEGM